MRLSRRRALSLAAAAVATRAGGRLVVTAAAREAERHGMSAFGDLALPPDFPHFRYVNPQAPKGGVYSEVVSSRGYNGSFLTFNSLNSYILKG
jgi:microcin C transport system substrate-binding protein